MDSRRSSTDTCFDFIHFMSSIIRNESSFLVTSGLCLDSGTFGVFFGGLDFGLKECFWLFRNKKSEPETRDFRWKVNVRKLNAVCLKKNSDSKQCWKHQTETRSWNSSKVLEFSYNWTAISLVAGSGGPALGTAQTVQVQSRQRQSADDKQNTLSKKQQQKMGNLLRYSSLLTTSDCLSCIVLTPSSIWTRFSVL